MRHKWVRCVLLIGVLSLLTACEPSIDKEARENGCGGLRRDVHSVFVLAGWWNVGQKDIAAHERQYPTSRLYRIVEEKKYRGYGGYNEKYYFAATAFFEDLQSGSENLGDRLAMYIEREFSEDFYRAETFKKCARYLNHMFEEPEYIERINAFYAYPRRYDKFEG